MHFDMIVILYLSEKLLNSHGRELRRALFSLKQIFQVPVYEGLKLLLR